VARHNVPEFEVFSGNALRLTREVLGINLKEIALYSGIPLSHLKNIELERFDLLPPIGYIKAFLKKYAEYLSLDSQKVINDYLKRFDKKSKS
jgi:cytoskeleton protein RodZ